MNASGYNDPTADQAIHNVDKEKPWRKVTAEERNKNKKEFCCRCEYATRMSREDNYTLITCDYLSITGHSRGCSPINCKKFKPRITKRRKHKLTY